MWEENKRTSRAGESPPPLGDIQGNASKSRHRWKTLRERKQGRQQGRQQDRQQGRKQGRQQGREQEPPPSRAMVDIVSGVRPLVGGG